MYALFNYVFNWIYRKSQGDYEEQMNEGASHMVEEAQASSKI